MVLSGVVCIVVGVLVTVSGVLNPRYLAKSPEQSDEIS
jgi:hypothetical protein